MFKEPPGASQIEQVKASLLTRQVPESYRSFIAKEEEIFLPLDEPLSTLIPRVIFRPTMPIDRSYGYDYGSREKAFTAIRREASAGNQTEFGKVFGGGVKGRQFVDLGCGHPNFTGTSILLAQVFGASTYFGIDRVNVKQDELDISLAEGVISQMESYFFKMSMLEFLARMQTDQPTAFFISGIGYDFDTKERKQYVSDCLEEMGRIAKAGDPIILFKSHEWNPTEHGFKEVIQTKAPHYAAIFSKV